MGDLWLMTIVFLGALGANIATVHYVRWLDRQPYRNMPEVFKRRFRWRT